MYKKCCLNRHEFFQHAVWELLPHPVFVWKYLIDCVSQLLNDNVFLVIDACFKTKWSYKLTQYWNNTVFKNKPIAEHPRISNQRPKFYIFIDILDFCYVWYYHWVCPQVWSNNLLGKRILYDDDIFLPRQNADKKYIDPLKFKMI
jgi:hypothetical protein